MREGACARATMMTEMPTQHICARARVWWWRRLCVCTSARVTMTTMMRADAAWWRRGVHRQPIGMMAVGYFQAAGQCDLECDMLHGAAPQ